MVFLHALEGLISIILMVLVGYMLARKGWFSEDSTKLIPKLVNYVSLPTYMIWNLMSTFDKAHFLPLLYGIAVPVLSMGINFVVGYGISQLIGLNPNQKGIFRAAFFCSSSVFVGVPVNLALFGDTSIPYVLVYFLANAFLFWTIGNYSISLNGKAAPPKIVSEDTVKRVFSPPFTAFAVGVVLLLLGLQLPEFVLNTFKYLGGMTTPLSMIFIGITMFGVKLRDIKMSKDVWAVLAGRFVVAPLAVLLVASFIPLPDLMKKVFVIQSALPAMTQTTVLAELYGADTEYAAVLVSITTIFAALAIPVYMVLI